MKIKQLLVISIGIILLTMSACTTTSMVGKQNTLSCTTDNYTVKWTK